MRFCQEKKPDFPIFCEKSPASQLGKTETPVFSAGKKALPAKCQCAIRMFLFLGRKKPSILPQPLMGITYRGVLTKSAAKNSLFQEKQPYGTLANITNRIYLRKKEAKKRLCKPDYVEFSPVFVENFCIFPPGARKIKAFRGIFVENSVETVQYFPYNAVFRKIM